MNDINTPFGSPGQIPGKLEGIWNYLKGGVENFFRKPAPGEPPTPWSKFTTGLKSPEGLSTVAAFGKAFASPRTEAAGVLSDFVMQQQRQKKLYDLLAMLGGGMQGGQQPTEGQQPQKSRTPAPDMQGSNTGYGATPWGRYGMDDPLRGAFQAPAYFGGATPYEPRPTPSGIMPTGRMYQYPSPGEERYNLLRGPF